MYTFGVLERLSRQNEKMSNKGIQRLKEKFELSRFMGANILKDFPFWCLLFNLHPCEFREKKT